MTIPTTDPRPSYPFAALVGQEALKDALLWLAVDPGIGGLLVTGTRGTAKSTAVRALADLLPPLADANGGSSPTPFVELPVGATEDRVVGTLDVRSLLAEAERRFEPGLLARADRGILYVDEVNLLPDHLVDVILDAAATGRNVVERDGASFAHAARIMLIGTMNPEEGELRPQLLDRFGLCVAVESDTDLDRRVEILERRIAFERDPAAFVQAHQAASNALRARIVEARALLSRVELDRETLRSAAMLALQAHVEGMRADLAIARTARAIAALDGRVRICAEDIERAAGPALAHRRREAPPQGTPPPPRGNPPPPPPKGERQANEGSAALRTFDVGSPSKLTLDAHDRTVQPRQAPRESARGRSETATPSGRTRVTNMKTSRIAPLATTLAAARERTAEGIASPLAIGERHLRFWERQGRERRLIIFLVDASGSMAAAARMRAAKGVVCSLLEEAYHRRDAVALVAFRGDGAHMLVPPTRSAALAYRRLRTLPTGGRTPLAEGLRRAHDLLVAQQRRDARARAHLVLISDARANLPERAALEAALREATALRERGIRALCVDTETARIRLGHAARVARALGAKYRHLDDCGERALGATVREWMATA